MRTLVHAMAAGVVLMVATAALAQEAVPFRYQASKEPLIYRKVTKMKQMQMLMQKKIVTDVTQTEVDVWSVAEKDKNLEIKSETKLLQVKMNIGGLGDYEFDSRKDDNEKSSTLGAALTPLYERLRDAQLSCTITPQGKITKLTGFKELIEDVIKDNPIAKQFAAGGSEDAAKLGIAEYIPLLTDKAVAPGQRWESPFEINLDKFGKATGKRLYAYDGEGTVGKRKTAKLSVAIELSFELNLDMDAAKITGTMTVTQSKGTIHFDPQRGCIVSLTNEYTLGGNLNVAAGGQNIPIAIEQVQSVSMELLDQLPK